MGNSDYQLAVEKLQVCFATRNNDSALNELIIGRDACMGVFQPIFTPDGASRLTVDEFKSFLVFRNNKHWTALSRNGPRVCGDLQALRKAVALLLDESKPVGERLNSAASAVSGLGKALITAILTVAYPAKYGVWNKPSESALVHLKVWPKFSRGLSFGDRYACINDVLVKLARDVAVDLWTLDALLWRVLPQEQPSAPNSCDAAALPVFNQDQRFGLERHLHEFLRDNWARTPLGKDWDLHTEPGDPDAGYEYRTEIGNIDLLAKHRRKPSWLVVELKRAQSSDDTLGQVLRYIGWVRQNLAEKNDHIEGLIIAHDTSEKLSYALSEVSAVKLLLYDVSFSLRGTFPISQQIQVPA